MGKWPNRDNAVYRKLTRCPKYFCQNLGISPPSLPLVWFKDKVKGPEDERWREHWGSSGLLGSLGNLNIVLDPWRPTSCIYLSSSHHLLSMSVSPRRDGKMPTMLSRPGRLCKVCLVVLNFDIIHQLSDQPWKISFNMFLHNIFQICMHITLELKNMANFCFLHEFENTYNQNSRLSI